MVGRPAPPGQVRERGEGRDGRLVAVEEVSAEQDGSPDRGRATPADERPEDERDRARGKGHDAEPQGEPDGRLDRDLVAGQAGEGHRADDAAEAMTTTMIAIPVDVGGELLERDAAHA